MKNNGFTMIEILVAMVVLAIGLLGMAGMTIIVMRGNRGAVDMTAASQVCQQKIEELKDLSWGEIGNALISDPDEAAFFGAQDGAMVQEGSVNSGEGLNSQGLTKQGFYEQENGVAGSFCETEHASIPSWENSDPDCVDYVRGSGPYKFARTFVVCRGTDYDGTTGYPMAGTEAVATTPITETGVYRGHVEPDCRVDPTVSNSRTLAVGCAAEDITTATGPGSTEKKIKALCAWRDSNGACHSLSMETTVVQY